MIEIADLPGADLIRRGIADAAAGRPSVEALLVLVAATRLRQLGLPIPSVHLASDPDRGLYEAVGSTPGVNDPYARYNSLRRELDSFVEALERHRRAVRRAEDSSSDQ